MKTMSASEAKTHFGVLMDCARQEPVTIEKQGRPVAVVISYESYQEQHSHVPGKQDRDEAMTFLRKWSERGAVRDVESKIDNDSRAQAIWEKYSSQG